jgi:hypothetical protein
VIFRYRQKFGTDILDTLRERACHETAKIRKQLRASIFGREYHELRLIENDHLLQTTGPFGLQVQCDAPIWRSPCQAWLHH